MVVDTLKMIIDNTLVQHSLIMSSNKKGLIKKGLFPFQFSENYSEQSFA